MRRFFYAIGVLASTVIVIVGIIAGVIIYKGRALDAESKAFVNGAVPAIIASWNKEQLLSLGTPELRRSVKPDELSARWFVSAQSSRQV